MISWARYRAFAQQFQAWHYRMTPEGTERASAPMLLSMLQGLNLAGLALWLPSNRWHGFIVGGCVASGLVLYLMNARVFAGVDLLPKHARWTDRVPGVREFPCVYGYLLFTVAMLFVPMWVLS
ncbi:MAG TPA: hypothetical protein VGE88_05740 [Lysobacter sp.]